MRDATVVEEVRRKYAIVSPVLGERSRRRWAAAEASGIGWGGVSAVAAATGLARDTVRVGLREASEQAGTTVGPRLRRPGGGRRRLVDVDPGMTAALDALVEPSARGDPESPLRWTCKSTRRLAAELAAQGHPASPRTVAALLSGQGFSLQADRKTREGSGHPDRNAQFLYVNERVRRLRRAGQPVVSVDTKKKELVGDFKNGGRGWHRSGRPPEVRVHDFVDPALGKAIPYGVYDLTNNAGRVSVGVGHDTAAFAAATILRWWRETGEARFPRAGRLPITADGGGSNGSRSRLWPFDFAQGEASLQRLADETGLKPLVCQP